MGKVWQTAWVCHCDKREHSPAFSPISSPNLKSICFKYSTNLLNHFTKFLGLLVTLKISVSLANFSLRPISLRKGTKNFYTVSLSINYIKLTVCCLTWFISWIWEFFWVSKWSCKSLSLAQLAGAVSGKRRLLRTTMAIVSRFNFSIEDVWMLNCCILVHSNLCIEDWQHFVLNRIRILLSALEIWGKRTNWSHCCLWVSLCTFSFLPTTIILKIKVKNPTYRSVDCKHCRK